MKYPNGAPTHKLFLSHTNSELLFQLVLLLIPKCTSLNTQSDQLSLTLGPSIEKVSEILNYNLQSIMKHGESYIQVIGNFLAIKVPKVAIFITTNVVGLYPNIPRSENLGVLKKQYENFPSKKVSRENIKSG